MLFTDYILLFSCMIGISLYGLYKTRKSQKKEQTAREAMVGSDISVPSATLAMCSGFISSISVLGFPAEVYYQGGMMLWYAPMYFISFPLVAYVFLPVLYKLKLTTIYEYFERRFNYNCRFVTTLLFCVQMMLYNSVALYAPSLAIATITKIPITISILITAILSAVYISVGGAKAGIHTSAIQMALIIFTMAFIVSISIHQMGWRDILDSITTGKRLILNDFRINPTIRHSVWSLVIGGTGNILSLFGANQLSVQRCLAMPSLEKAQKVLLWTIGCNSVILFLYVSVGFSMFAFYKDCHPTIGNANELLPQFVIDVISTTPGSVGLFAAAVYSAGISTLSASFTAVSSILINDVWNVFRKHKKQAPLNSADVHKAMRILPMLCSMLQGIILQVSFIVFGAGGGPVLGSFVIGLFLPRVKGLAAFIGLLASIVACFSISIGSVLVKVKPVQLELGQCGNSTMSFYDDSHIGEVTSTPLAYGFDRIFAVSYQYYSVIGIITNVFVAYIMQLFIDVCSPIRNHSEICLELVSPLLASSAPHTTHHDPEPEQHNCTQQETLPC
ncbi:hypothetical protein CRE_07367 [Caenorhabditis remanei]|uniref:Uncharacterized protein n=1 Tax=Caenorhabditis remanei TaxID=31234 RepID=E3M2I9_CAERE|nr:hypothetical protein CRE_07367 [Caenorhabditis remanei]